jgi:hypothetical protein
MNKQSINRDYANRLNRLVDEIFQVACDKQMTWAQLADKSGLTPVTVHRLGERITKFPQYRTMELLAQAVGGRLKFMEGQQAASKLKISWKPRSFSNRKKKVA